MIGNRLRLVAASALVNANLVAALPTKQTIHGHAHYLAQDVPQGVFDAADGCIDNKPAWESREVHHHCPQVLDIPRVLAHQPTFEVVDGRDRGAAWPARIGLADAVNSLVGLDFDENQIAGADSHDKSLDVGDLDVGAASRHRLSGSRQE